MKCVCAVTLPKNDHILEQVTFDIQKEYWPTIVELMPMQTMRVMDIWRTLRHFIINTEPTIRAVSKRQVY